MLPRPDHPAPTAVEEELPLARIRELLEQVREHVPAEVAWELGIQLENLAEGQKELAVRVRALEEENRHLQERLAHGHKEHARLRASMSELLDLQELSAAISTSFHIQDILYTLLDLSQRVAEYQHGGVFTLDPSGGAPQPLVLRGDTGRLEAAVRTQWEEGIIGWILKEGRPVVVEDEELAGNSTVFAPLRVRGEQLGFCALSCPRSRDDFTFGELESLDVLASHAAVALENARLYTDLETAHRELKESQHQLLLSAKLAAIGELAGGVAHEVNNPLQIILSRVQLMLIQHRGEGRLTEHLQLIENNVKRISRIIRALLGFARHNSPGAGWGSFNLAQALHQACTLVRHQLTTHLIEIFLDCPDDLPELAGDVGELEQVFINLILNAQYAMPTGGQLRIAAHREGEWVEIRFADTGAGIPPENLDRIFEPFFTTRSDLGGTGLGLPVSYRIVERHGGTLTVESAPGQGATFIIRLPLQRREES